MALRFGAADLTNGLQKYCLPALSLSLKIRHQMIVLAIYSNHRPELFLAINGSLSDEELHELIDTLIPAKEYIEE